MMRILVANPSVGVGGAELHTFELCKALAHAGHAVVHAMEKTARNAALFADEANGLVNLPIGWHRTVYPREETQRQKDRMRAALATHRPDFLLLPLSYPDAAPGLLEIAVESGLPTLVIFHLARRTIQLGDLQQRIYARAASAKNIHWVAVSPWLAETVSQVTGIPSTAINVIRNGAFRSVGESADFSDKAAVRASVTAELGLDERDTIALTVARIDPQKNHLDLVAAANAVVRVRPDVKFVWLGEGSFSETVDEAIRAAGLSSYIVRLGHRSDVERFYKAADMFVLPTSVEGDSLSLAEAAFYGLPIVTTDASGQDRTYPDEDAALIVSVGAVEALGAAILRLVRDKALAGRLSAGATRLAAQHSKARMLSRYEDLIGRIIATAVPAVPHPTALWLVVEDFEDVLACRTTGDDSDLSGWLVAEAMREAVDAILPSSSRRIVFPTGAFGQILDQHVFPASRLVLAKARSGLANVRRWAQQANGLGIFVAASISSAREAQTESTALRQLADTENFGAAWLFSGVEVPAQVGENWADFNRRLLADSETGAAVSILPMEAADGGFRAPLRDLYLEGTAGLRYLETLDRHRRLSVLRSIVPRQAVPASVMVMKTLVSFLQAAPVSVIQDFARVVIEVWPDQTDLRAQILNTLRDLIGLPSCAAYDEDLARAFYRALGEARFNMVQYLGEGRGTTASSRGAEKTALYFFRRIPYPVRSGSDARALSTMRLLQSLGYTCVFASYCKPNEVTPTLRAAEAFRRNFGVKVDVHILTSAEADTLTNLASSTSWETFMMASLHRHIRRLSEILSPDLVFVNFPQYAYLSICGGAQGAVSVIDGHDILSSRSSIAAHIDRWVGRDERTIIAAPNSRLFDISEYMYDGGFDDTMEMQLYRQFSSVLAISPVDYDYLRHRCPRTNICLLPIICENIADLGQEDGLPLFMGSVNQFNAIAASYIVNDLLPKMRALYPDFQVRFVGGICDLLPDAEGIVKEGVVHQIEHVYRKTSFVLAPLFWGSGQNVKIIEAMGYGVPSVTFTEIAGRCGLTDAQAMIARDAAEFFEHTRALHRDPRLVRTLGRNGIRHALGEHSVATARARLQTSLVKSP